MYLYVFVCICVYVYVVKGICMYLYVSVCSYLLSLQRSEPHKHTLAAGVPPFPKAPGGPSCSWGIAVPQSGPSDPPRTTYKPSQNYLQTCVRVCVRLSMRACVCVRARSRAHVRGGWGPAAWARGSGRRTSHCRPRSRSAWQSRGSSRAVVTQQLYTCKKDQTEIKRVAARCAMHRSARP